METAIQRNENFWYATPDITVLWDNSVAPMTRFIFTILCSFATLKKRNAWPSNKTVADIVGVSVATVKRAYSELIAKGIIMRVPRYKKDKGQTSSLTYLIGREAPCYLKPLTISEPPADEPHVEPVEIEPDATPRLTSELPPGSPMSHKENNLKDSKDSLTREAKLPNKRFLKVKTPGTTKISKTYEDPEKKHGEKPIVRGQCSLGASGVATSSVKGHPKEVCSPDDAPDIMRATAEYFLQKTGRKGLRVEEISILREFSATQYPSRVQKEIQRACARLRGKNKPLECLTLMYIAAALKNQPTFGRKAKAKKSKAKPIATKKEYTEAELDAMQAEADALQARLDAEEDERRRKLLL